MDCCAARTRRASQSVVPDVDELTRIADLIEPARFKALVLNSAWCCLRYDEVTELRPQGYWRRCRSHRWFEEIVTENFRLASPLSRAAVIDVTASVTWL